MVVFALILMLILLFLFLFVPLLILTMGIDAPLHPVSSHAPSLGPSLCAVQSGGSAQDLAQCLMGERNASSYGGASET